MHKKLNAWRAIALILAAVVLFLLCSCTAAPVRNMPEQDEPPTYRKYTVVIVPGWLWENGGSASFEEYRLFLQRWGAPHKFVETDSADSLEQNAKRIRRAIASTDGPVILVTGSRGTLETVVALAGVVGPPADFSERLVLWVNVSGAQFGTPISNEWTRKVWVWGTPFWAWGAGSTYAQIYAMRTDVSRERFWKLWPYVPRIPTVSIVTRYNGDKQGGFIGVFGCKQMEANKPHDCLIRCIDQPLPGSAVLEVESGHMLDTGIQAPLINRVINAATAQPRIWNVAQ